MKKMSGRDRSRVVAGVIAGLIIAAMLIGIIIPFAYGAEATNFLPLF